MLSIHKNTRFFFPFFLVFLTFIKYNIKFTVSNTIILQQMRIIIIISFLCMAISSVAQRKYVNEFLNIGIGARAFAMGGAVCASTEDVTSGYWNPAGLRSIPADFQLSLMHNEYFGGLAKYDYAGLAYKLANNKGNLGINIIRFAVDDIPYTLNLIKADGSIDYGALTKTISASDYAGIISYSRQLNLKRHEHSDDIYLTIGGNAKIIHRQIGSMAKAWGIGVDAGVKAQIRRWYVGAVLRDATTTYTGWTFSLTDREKTTFALTNNAIPVQSNEVMNPRLILGIARMFPLGDNAKLLTELDLDNTTDGARYGNIVNAGVLSINPHFGAELAYKKQYFVRAGFGGFQRVKDNTDTSYIKTTVIFQPSFGIGFYLNNLTIDYALTSLNLQQNPLYSNVFSLKMDLRKPKKFRKDANKKEL
ncbi:MAG: hypothetical protein RLZZ118_435 [Bacteroidota bacterium]|jgi:hypothetical protein